MKRWLMTAAVFLAALAVSTMASAGDLDDVKARGVLRHIGLPYANFNTGSGDGMEAELTKLFAKSLGVRYEFVESDWGPLIQDLIGKKVKVVNGKAELLEDAPVRGDLIANGLTIIPWRQQVVNFSTPTFPNQIWLVVRSDSPLRPIKPTGKIEKDIELTKALMKDRSILTLEKTCLDPALYNLAATGAKIINFNGKLNEIAFAMINKDAEMTILDVPDALVALDKWKGKMKILGPVSNKQLMAGGFSQDSPKLLEAYNAFIKKAQSDGTYMKLIKKYYPTAKTYFPEFFKGMK
ncbi:MAG: transporter substrate-binding domain-containing protein [Desulfuromonadales bacterium]